jgi:hypothetical protein
MMNLALPTLNILSLIILLLYMFISVCDNPIRDNFILSPKPLHLVIKR